MLSGAKEFLRQEKFLAEYNLKVNGDIWFVDHNGTGYNVFFRHVLNRGRPDFGSFEPEGNYEDYLLKIERGQTLQKEINARKSAGKSTHVFCFFGSGDFITDMSSVDSLSAFRLSDDAPESDKQTRPANIFVLPGNLYSPHFWKKDVSEHMANNGIPAIDMAVCRPADPFSHLYLDVLYQNYTIFNIRTYLSIYYPLLQRLYRLISSDDGEIFTQIPLIGLTKELVELWVNELNVTGVKAQNHLANVLHIIKTPNSPRDLPDFNFDILMEEVLQNIPIDFEALSEITQLLGEIPRDATSDEIINELIKGKKGNKTWRVILDSPVLRQFVTGALLALRR